MEDNDCACKNCPPAYRFDPTDRELCSIYLSAKLQGIPLPCEHAIAGEVDLYSASPWEILRDDDPRWVVTLLPSSTEPSKDMIKKTIYVFTKLRDMSTKSDEKGGNKTRTAGSGTWKAQNNNPVMDQGRKIGNNKYFGFYACKDKKRKKSDQGTWRMHEYTLDGDDEKYEHYALCKISVVKKVKASEDEAENNFRNCEVNVRLPVDTHVSNQQLHGLNMGPVSVKAETGSNLQVGGGLNDKQRRHLGYINGRNQVEAINNITGPVVSHVHNQHFHTLNVKPISAAATASNLQACGCLNCIQRQNLGYNGHNQEVLNVHKHQPSSTALEVADRQQQYLGDVDHPQYVHVTYHEVHHMEPAASSLDSNNVHNNNQSSMEAMLEEDLKTVDNFLNPDPRVLFNIDTTDNHVGSTVVKELPVAVNDQRNYLGDGGQEVVNLQVQESNVQDGMASFDGMLGADNWSSEFDEAIIFTDLL